jgi:hypothetical protein
MLKLQFFFWINCSEKNKEFEIIFSPETGWSLKTAGEQTNDQNFCSTVLPHFFLL